MQYLGLPLARRLESCEGAAGVQFVEARAQLFPETGACHYEAAGASATFDGPHSPITQSFGLGMSGMPTEAEMDSIETFFHSRGAPAHHEVSPLAPKELLTVLTARGYRPIELTDVMFLPLPAGTKPPSTITVRLAGPDELEIWAATAAEGWREFGEIAGQVADLARVFAARTGALSFLAEENGRPVATGGLVVHEGVALMAGASTVPQFRRRGAQRALFNARLAHASQLNCDLAMVCTEPGSDSQRNAAHHGFRIAYTRIKWALDAPDALRLRN
jgi:hypothetical protein